MGFRIHVATEYQVKYQYNGQFSLHQPEINRFLHEHCEGLSWEGEDLETAEHLEVYRNELADLIAKIVSDRDAFNRWAKRNGIDTTADEFICIIADWISKSDQRNDYVVLNWH